MAAAPLGTRDSPAHAAQKGRRALIAPHTLIWEATAVWRSVRRALSDAGPERDTAVQSLKAAGAALLAWAVADWWWDAPMALMAPWTALFLVQSTVYRSLLYALQQLAVVVVGTLLAAAAGVLTHNEMAAMAVALPLTVLLGNYARFGTQGLYAPTAALFVLAYGSYSGSDIAYRLLETLLGAAIAICVNALVLPPVHSRRMGRLRAQLPQESAELLHDVADGLAQGRDEEQARGWYDRAQRLTDVVTDLREARRWSEESYRVNPGRRFRREPPTPPAVAWDFVWDQMTEHIATTIRTLAEPTRRPPLPSDVRDALVSVLRAAGDTCRCDQHARHPAGGDSAAVHAAEQARRALARAAAAHRRLTALCLDHHGAPATTIGGILADTRRLLSALVRIADPEAAFEPRPSAHRPSEQATVSSRRPSALSGVPSSYE
jgi:hypothetical protein